jgi:tellurite resistance protein
LKKEHLDTSKSFSKKLSAYIDTALSILDVIINTAASTASTNDNVFADQLSPMNELLKGLQALSTSANLVLQQPGCASKGLAVPTTPTDSSSGAGPVCV